MLTHILLKLQKLIYNSSRICSTYLWFDVCKISSIILGNLMMFQYTFASFYDFRQQYISSTHLVTCRTTVSASAQTNTPFNWFYHYSLPLMSQLLLKKTFLFYFAFFAKVIRYKSFFILGPALCQICCTTMVQHHSLLSFHLNSSSLFL